jgi:hypothetical protein
MKPSMLKYSASGMLTTESGTWPRTWPTSRNYTMTCDGKNRTPYGPLLVPTPFTALSHASSMMPRQPRTFHRLCSMPASTTLRTGGSMALNSIISVVSGARETGTPHATVHASTNVYSIMGQGTKNSCATSLTKDAKPVESATFPTITLEWLTPIAHRTLGPLDDGGMLTKG